MAPTSSSLPSRVALATTLLVLLMVWGGGASAASPAGALARVSVHVVEQQGTVLVPVQLVVPPGQSILQIGMELKYDSTLWKVVGCYSDYKTAQCHGDEQGGVGFLVMTDPGVEMVETVTLITLQFQTQQTEGASPLRLSLTSIQPESAMDSFRVQDGWLCITACPPESISSDSVPMQRTTKDFSREQIPSILFIILSVITIGIGIRIVVARQSRKPAGSAISRQAR